MVIDYKKMDIEDFGEDLKALLLKYKDYCETDEEALKMDLAGLQEVHGELKCASGILVVLSEYIHGKYMEKMRIQSVMESYFEKIDNELIERSVNSVFTFKECEESDIALFKPFWKNEDGVYELYERPAFEEMLPRISTLLRNEIGS